MALPLCAFDVGVCAGARHTADQCNGTDFDACGPSQYGADFLVDQEICDGLDNDCDNSTDEVSGLILTACENQVGACADAMHTADRCQGGGWLACLSANYEADPTYGPEICDLIDNDCNGLTDSADAGLFLDICEKDEGVCDGAVHRPSLCQPDGFGGAEWSACDYLDYGSDYEEDEFSNELCDGLDNDCDNVIDGTEGDVLSNRACELTNAWGTCGGLEDCQGATGWGGCDAPPAAEEVCDDADNDCDGATDGDDPSMVLEDCENQKGVCEGSLHRASQCVNGLWNPCEGLDYGSHSFYYGPEICGNSLDEDCSGLSNDKDVDGDSFRAEDCGGADCDDEDPDTYPGATEIRDAKDNNCDGVPDEGLINQGDVIITEMMINPNVSDTVAEWFEVTNVSIFQINLSAWHFYDLNSPANQFNVSNDIVIGPNERAVFCVNADSGINGGVDCDYDYDNFQLANASAANPDEIIMDLQGFEIDRVIFTASSAGRSTNLDPSNYDYLSNNNMSNWCYTPSDAAYQLDGGDYGTPGEFNVSCAGALSIMDVDPASGVDVGGETLTIFGTSFDGSTTVTVGGAACTSPTIITPSKMTCVTPDLSGSGAGDYDVVVTKGAFDDTLINGYRATAEDLSPGIGWCDLQDPASVVTTVNVSTVLIFGQVYKDGVTLLAGPPAGIGAQLGYGPLGSDPRVSPGWIWSEATWNASCAACGDNDEFMENLTLDAAGSYSYVYRFSEDGGYTFSFCDYNPGTANGFSTSDMGALTVN
ncbi:MAG: IPT/TIG domain-containing protein [Deltaproteobacteria bacterium]|nr:IPT/TIG domain-containing protein [Deltaproteobacteria bacterium]